MILDKPDHLRRSLQHGLEAADLAAVIAVSPENFLHTAGVHVPSQRMIRERLALCVIGRDADPFAVVSSVVARTVARASWLDDVVTWAEHDETPILRLAHELTRRGLGEARIALEMSYLPASFYLELQEALPGVTWVDADALLKRSRMVKTPQEIELMRRNALIAERAMFAGFLFSQTGTAERDIAQRMRSSLVELGGDGSPFMSLAAGAERTREPHAVPGSHRIEPGDTLAVDMVGMFQGYYSDYARMAVVGTPSAGQRDAWHTVVDIQRRLMDDVVPGAVAQDIYRKAARYADEAGSTLGTNLVGHGLGIGLHEHPVLTDGCEEELRPGMTMCIEILVMDPEHGRFHVEDLVEVREDGPARRLTTYFDTRELHAIQS